MFCNGVVSSLASLLHLLSYGNTDLRKYLALVVLSSISCCCGDTFASEFGSVVDARPRLITTSGRVPRGTNGGVSPAGTLASAVGGAIIGVTFYITQQWTFGDIEISSVLILVASLGGGLIGSLIDSLLGATLQYSGCNVNTGRICHTPPSPGQPGASQIKHISGRDVLSNNQVNLLSSLLTGLAIPLICLYLLD